MSKIQYLLHRRGMTLRRLAQAARVSSNHLTLVMANVPGRGHQVRRKVAPLLTPEERAVVGWDEKGRIRAS